MTKIKKVALKDNTKTGYVDTEQMSEAAQVLMANFFSIVPDAKKNEITGEIEAGGVPLSGISLNTIFLRLRFWQPKLKEQDFYLFLGSEYIPSYHPIKDWFESRKDKKPKGLIKALADCIDTDMGVDDGNFFPEYVYYFIRKWLVSAIAQVYGHTNPLCLVLSGGQGTGKSEFFKRLCPPELKRFFAETKLDETRESDLAMLMCENMFCFDDEFSGKSKQDQKHFKYLTSKSSFRYRRPYQKSMETSERLATLCGTSNDYELLNDPTGNRRIIPIHVKSINHDAYNLINKESLFIEAYHEFLAGFSTHEWELKKKDVEVLNENTAKFEAVDRDIELILSCFSVPTEKDKLYIQKMSASEIATHIKLWAGINLQVNSLGVKLKKLGFVQLPVAKINGNAVRNYAVVVKELVTIEEARRLTEKDLQNIGFASVTSGVTTNSAQQLDLQLGNKVTTYSKNFGNF